jgi:hypothetical protein
MWFRLDSPLESVVEMYLAFLDRLGISHATKA